VESAGAAPDTIALLWGADSLNLHSFQIAGTNYLFFPRSARLYQLSRAAASIVKELCTAPSAVAAEELTFPDPLGQASFHLQSSLHDLIQGELAVTPPAPTDDQLQAGSSLQAFSIYLSQSCNMSCCYCWNRGGSFGNSPRLMNEQDAQKATARIAALAAESAAETISVNFYGGEPLLNFPLLKSMTLALREREAELGKRFRFSVDTNGWLLEGEVAQFLALHFSHIGVSLDGREEIHDRQRPGGGGERTWRRVATNIGNFPDKRLLGLRATLTAHSDSYLKTFCNLAKFGVRSIQLEYCHDPLSGAAPEGRELVVPLERQQREMTEFVEHYVDAISHFKETCHIPFVSNLMENIFRMRGGARYTRPCGAGLSTIAFNSAGGIFPCIALVDQPEFLMGDSASRDPLVLRQDLAAFQVDQHATCGNCWLRYDCAGGCYATHCKLTGSISRPHPDYCRGMMAKTEVYLHGMALMLDKCPWHLEDPAGTAG
jgi:uncharacterized protein